MTRIAAVAVSMSCFVSAASAQDAQRLAAPCAICHGTDGKPATKELVPLAGLPRDYIVAQMRAFRDGTRAASIMPQLAKGYSDAQVEALAEYFARRPR